LIRFSHFSNRLSPLTRGFWIFALINSLLVPLTLAVLTRFSLNDAVLQETYGYYLHARQGRDSWRPMAQAIDYARGEDHPQPIYAEIFFNRGIKFQYPPSSLLPLGAIRKLAPSSAWPRVLNLISLFCFAISIALTLRILTSGLRAAGPGSAGGRGSLEAAALIAAALLLALNFYPAVRAYVLGQIQVWVNALFVVALWCWIQGNQVGAGILVGSMCLLKPHYGLFLVWGALRRRWGFTLTIALTALAGVILSIAFFGWANHMDYLHMLSFLFRHGETYYPNQSMNGLLNRLLFNGNILDFDPSSLAPYHPWVFAGTSLSSIILLLTALLLPNSAGSKGGTIDFCILGLSVTMASSIAWEHHYGILLPIYAAAMPWLVENRIFGRATIPLLAGSYALTSNYFGVVHGLAHTRFNILQSTLYIGALLLLISLHVLRARESLSARRIRGAQLARAK